jgi:ParB family chromosome partitioning protein
MSITEHIAVTHLTDQHQTEDNTIEAPAGAAPAATGVDLVHVPAADVVIEDNVRTAADLDAAFLASVKRHGVLLPTIGYRNADGAVVVRDGQMRVLAAREAATTVPVFVTERGDSTAARIAEQLVANERRVGLTDADRLQAYRQLELEGLSATAIARETGTKRDTVKQTLTVAKSDTASAAVTSGQATFTQALLLAEFDGDAEAITELTECIAEGYDDDELTHTATRLRQEAEHREARAKVRADLIAEGKRVVGDDDDYESLSRLTDAADDVTDYAERHTLDPETHVECAGAAWEVREWGTPEPVQVCATPDAHRPYFLAFRATGPVGGGAAEAGKSDEDRAAEAEERKAARRALVANNKAWDAADVVRREWVAGLLQRKTAPKDAARFLAVALTRHATIRYANGMVSARGLLGIETTGWEGDTLSQWVEEHPTKGLHMSLAVVFAGFENTANREWWRTPDRESRGYLNQLADWGYPLSRVEQLAAGIQPTDDTDDAESEGEDPDADQADTE